MKSKFGGIEIESGVSKFGGVPITTNEIQEPEINTIEEKQHSSGLGRRIIGDIKERTQAIGDFIERSDSPILESPKIAAVAFGQAAGGIGDIISESIMSGYKTVVTEETQLDIKNMLIDFSQTEVGKMGLSALESGQDTFNKFEQKFPDAAIALGSMLNIFGLSVATKGIKLTAKELSNIGEDLSILASKALPEQAEKITNAITRQSISKAIRPSVVKGKTAAQANQFFKNANEAVHTIIENKSKLNLTDDAGNIIEGLPTNLRQFTEAIGNTKKEIFKQYDKIAKISGQRGATIDLTNISNELDSIITNRGMSSEIKAYAQQQKDELMDLRTFNADEAPTRIQVLNNKLSSVTDFNSAAKASVDSLIANKLRASLNDVIEQTTGKQYKELKRRYGSLKDIERDVNRRAMVDARKNTKGLIDFTDVFTGAEVVRGIVSLRPSSIAAGLTGKAIATFTKALNDPNRIIKNMFRDVDNIIIKNEKLNSPLRPQSATLKKFIK